MAHRHRPDAGLHPGARQARRAPDDATTAWWRKDRAPEKAFVDFNQNARDHTIACAYSVRGIPSGRVSTPFAWQELDQIDPADFTIATVPQRFAEIGDLHATLDQTSFEITPLLEWADRDGLDEPSDGADDPGEGPSEPPDS